MAESSGTGKWIAIVILAVIAALALFMVFGKGGMSNEKAPDKIDVKIEAPAKSDAAPAS